jgi:nickel/cobalt transporter (NicO) family protein
MTDANIILLGTAASIGLFHTLVGVDHTLPFIVLARSQKWSLRKLWWVTGLCGLGHLLSSVLIGTIGIGLGVALDRLEWLEATRGGLAARLLIGFGLAYMIWGLVKSARAHRHSHVHHHDDGTVHLHEHDHEQQHVHVHGEKRMTTTAKTATVMGLFVVFILGPCEALIPMLLAPAFERSWFVVAGVVLTFGGATLATMLTVVTVGWYGMRWRGMAVLERHLHAVAGFAIAASGLAIELLGV